MAFLRHPTFSSRSISTVNTRVETSPRTQQFSLNGVAMDDKELIRFQAVVHKVTNTDKHVSHITGVGPHEVAMPAAQLSSCVFLTK